MAEPRRYKLDGRKSSEKRYRNDACTTCELLYNPNHSGNLHLNYSLFVYHIFRHHALITPALDLSDFILLSSQNNLVNAIVVLTLDTTNNECKTQSLSDN